MAINFSASFAACLAAGFKVPRQFMYCIAQDTGQPYVLYKDGMERGDMQWGASPQLPDFGPPAPHGSSSSGSPQAMDHPPQPVAQVQTAPDLVSPVPSPFPDQQQQPHSVGVNGGGEEDAKLQVQPQVTVQEAVAVGNDRHCFPDMSQYYSRGGGGGGNHMLSPGSFMSYLKQPGVMLTTLNAAEETNGDFAPPMPVPDLLAPPPGHPPPKRDSLRLFKCLTCGKDFKQKSTLLQHERIHTDSRPYGCSECGKRFRQQSHLTQHLRIHANEKPFACVYCERSFRQRAILNQHLRIHSDVSPHLVYKNGQLWPQDLPFPQEKDNGFDPNDQCFSPDSLNQFPAYFKDSKGITHGVFGGGQSKGLPDVIQHGRSAGMPLYVRCPICQKEFKQKSTLLQHGCIHIESRPYPCGECGKRFRQQSHLTQHLRIHTNEKPYACLYCGRNFRQRTILNQHVRIHTGEKPYKCAQCGKDFRQKAILDQHTRTHQGDRPFCCPMPNCRRRFATEQEVKRHIDNHMNPHAKRRDKRPTPVLQPAAMVKPELYFPQCYANPAHTAFTQQYSQIVPHNEFKSPPLLHQPAAIVQ